MQSIFSSIKYPRADWHYETGLSTSPASVLQGREGGTVTKLHIQGGRGEVYYRWELVA